MGSKRAPEWLCPATLRWVAGQLDDERLRAQAMAYRCRAERWTTIADALCTAARRLRTRATRIERRKESPC